MDSASDDVPFLFLLFLFLPFLFLILIFMYQKLPEIPYWSIIVELPGIEKNVIYLFSKRCIYPEWFGCWWTRTCLTRQSTLRPCPPRRQRWSQESLACRRPRPVKERSGRDLRILRQKKYLLSHCEFSKGERDETGADGHGSHHQEHASHGELLRFLHNWFIEVRKKTHTRTRRFLPWL